MATTAAKKGPQCHYEVLGISRKATDADIKQAYRRYVRV